MEVDDDTVPAATHPARPSYRWKELATAQKGLEFENNDPRLNEGQRVPSLGGSTSGAGGRRVRHRHLTTPGEVRLHVKGGVSWNLLPRRSHELRHGRRLYT